jgi:hypothetical protein
MAKGLSAKSGTRRPHAQFVTRKRTARPVAALKYKQYLRDLGKIVKTRAFEAKEERAREQEGSAEYHFQCGRLLAFNEVISILQQQAQGFNISLNDLNLEDLDPDRDLV